MFVSGFLEASVPGVSRMTEVTIREQMTRMTSSAIAIPFQFLCGGLLPTSSYNNHSKREPSEHDSGDRPSQPLLPLHSGHRAAAETSANIRLPRAAPQPCCLQHPRTCSAPPRVRGDCLHKESDMVPCLEECHPHKIPRWARLPHRLAWRLPLSKPHGVSMESHSSMMNRASPRSSLLLSFLYVHTASFDQ